MKCNFKGPVQFLRSLYNLVMCLKNKNEEESEKKEGENERIARFQMDALAQCKVQWFYNNWNIIWSILDLFKVETIMKFTSVFIWSLIRGRADVGSRWLEISEL